MTSIIGGLLGKKPKAQKILERFTPASFSAPGLSGTFDKASNTYSLQRTAQGQSILDELKAGFGQKAGEIRALRDQVRPGFGRLTNSRVEGIRAAGSRTVGNLREELSKRRVLGSSFAQREVEAVQMDFTKEEDRVRAESFLQELDLTNQLIAQEFDASLGGVQATLEQLNFETTVAAQLSQGASSMMLANLTAQAQARASNEAGAAEFLGTIIGAFSPV